MNSPSYNILLLGKTGDGKSTFINSIANYFTYKTFKEAIAADKPICIIPTVFDHTFLDLKTISISYLGENIKDVENENLSTSESATQHPRVYSFYNDDICFNIIDVPGTFSSYGIDRDLKNKKLTSNILKKFKRIHGVFIVMNSNHPWGPKNKFLEKFLEIFHISIVPNIFFIVTHARYSNFYPINAVEIFVHFKNELKKRPEIITKINKENVFCVDNEGYRYQCGWHISEEYRRSLYSDPISFNLHKTSWECSKAATIKIFERICTLDGHDQCWRFSVFRFFGRPENFLY